MKLIYPLLTIVLFTLFSCSPKEQKETFPTSLDGTNMTYQYTGGNAYNVKFEDGKVSYRFLTGSKPNIWWGPFPYQAVKKSNDEYFLSWYEEGYGDYVTHILNPAEKTLWGSALIVKEDKSIIHFQKATISEFKQ